MDSCLPYSGQVQKLLRIPGGGKFAPKQKGRTARLQICVYWGRLAQGMATFYSHPKAGGGSHVHFYNKWAINSIINTFRESRRHTTSTPWASEYRLHCVGSLWVRPAQTQSLLEKGPWKRNSYASFPISCSQVPHLYSFCIPFLEKKLQRI